MYQAAEIARDCGADYIQYRPYYLAPWFGGPESMDIAAFRHELEKCRYLASESFAVLHSADKFERMAANDFSRGYERCHGQQFCGVVTATGDVALCCLHRGHAALNLGNIMESDFKTIWNGERRRQVLEKLNIEKHCPPLCRCDGINEKIEAMLTATPTHPEFL
jgi:sulfatase maturation enzyme AslB (radical SAM superfamily)